MKQSEYDALAKDLTDMIAHMVGDRFVSWYDISYDVTDVLEHYIEVEEEYDVELRPPDGYVVKAPPKTIDMCGFTYRLEEKKDD